MGVSGCGKSTIGRLLSEKLAIPFFDGDDYHPTSNIQKMSSGTPLTDDDRQQWLINLNQLAIEQSRLNGAIIACSALKESYRDILKTALEKNVRWVVLNGPEEVIQERMSSRKNHFMPSHLLRSQFETLETPTYGVHVNITNTIETMLNIILKELDP